jgi:hypothetical protein
MTIRGLDLPCEGAPMWRHCRRLCPMLYRTPENVMTKVTLVAFAALIGSANPADAGCHVGRFRFSFDSDSSANMLVTGGSTCAINLWAGLSTAYESIRITSRPAHGTAASSGNYSVAYRPNAGFRGTDSFAFTVRGTGRVRPGVVRSSTIQVSVTVQ